MATQILTDNTGAEIGLIPLLLASGADSAAPVTVRATVPGTGFALRATKDAWVKLMGRIAGSGGAYQDLGTSPISLDPYSGTFKDFEIIARAGAVSGFYRANLTLGGATGTGAGWAL